MNTLTTEDHIETYLDFHTYLETFSASVYDILHGNNSWVEEINEWLTTEHQVRADTDTLQRYLQELADEAQDHPLHAEYMTEIYYDN